MAREPRVAVADRTGPMVPGGALLHRAPIPADLRARWGRPVAVGLTVALLAIAALLIVLRWGATARAGQLGIDYLTFLAFAERWLDTGSMYLPYQLAGPFDPRPLPHVPEIMPSMYPPHAVYLFAPFLVLPAVLWWTIPLGVIAWTLWRLRPAQWTWPILALILCLPETFTPVMVGGSTMWLIAFVCGGLLVGWPAVAVTIKPSLAPFALVGARRRAWWVGALVLGLAALPFGALWLDYATVVANAQTDISYSFGSLPSMMAPLIAWAGRRQPQQ